MLGSGRMVRLDKSRMTNGRFRFVLSTTMKFIQSATILFKINTALDWSKYLVPFGDAARIALNTNAERLTNVETIFPTESTGTKN